MGNYEVWVDAYDKKHEISRMDTDHIQNCLKELKKMANTWKDEKYQNLTDSELKLSKVVGQKAWYLINGKGYINAFVIELDNRKTQKTK